MKIGIVLLSLSVNLFVHITNAQSVAFKVLAVRGSVDAKVNGVWSSLKPGSKIPEHCDVRLSGNSYVGLLHVSGKPVELIKPGLYPYKDLHKSINSEKSPMQKYTAFLLAKNEQSKNRLAATGAVHRGGLDITLLLPEETINVLQSDLTILWRPNKATAPYRVIFADMFGNEIMRKVTNTEQVSISLDSGSLSMYNVFSIKVTSSSDPTLESAEHYIKRLIGENKQVVLEEYHELKQSIGDHLTPLTVLIESAFFEERRLPIEAITAIQRYIFSSESGDLLNGALDDLLARYGHGQEQ